MKVTSLAFIYYVYVVSLPLSTSASNCEPIVEDIRIIHGTPDQPYFYPAFLEYVEDGKDSCLYVSSFVSPFNPLSPNDGSEDFVARICNIAELENGDEDDEPYLEVVAGKSPDTSTTIWPNDIMKIPDGVLPFEALLIPQGFVFTDFLDGDTGLGRLTAVKLSSPDDNESENNSEEYIIQESTTANPWFYHNAVFYDMNDDGIDDIITVRSDYKFLLHSPPIQSRSNGVNGLPIPSTGQLVCFINPGKDFLDPDIPWEEIVLYSGSISTGNPGPDSYIEMADFHDDGVPEFVTTSFFSASPTGIDHDIGETILFGVTTGDTWSDVLSDPSKIQRKTIVSDQGSPMAMDIVDLNKDGKLDLLMTNHQNASSTIPGRVYAVEQPSSGNLFTDDWPVHILLDNIRPTPDPTGMRLAPGLPKAIHMSGEDNKPWLLVGGDQASKVYLLWPIEPDDSKNWEYNSDIIFDIGAKYDPSYKYISSIGEGIGVHSIEEEDEVIVYVPVYEAGDIHMLRIKTECEDVPSSAMSLQSNGYLWFYIHLNVCLLMFDLTLHFYRSINNSKF